MIDIQPDFLLVTGAVGKNGTFLEIQRFKSEQLP